MRIREILRRFRAVAADLERATGAKFDLAKLTESIKVYNAHNAAMRRVDEALARHSEITAAQRSDIFKSAFFMKKEEHTALVEELLAALDAAEPGAAKVKVMTTGILSDSPGLLNVFDDLGLHIAADNVAAQSRQYWWTKASFKRRTPQSAGKTAAPATAICSRFRCDL